MFPCPFREPASIEANFGDLAAEGQCFTQRDGLSLSNISLSTGGKQGSTFVWPFLSFSQLVFVKRGKVRLSLPDVGWQDIAANDWFAISLNGWDSICEFSDDVQMVAIECSQEIWKALASDLDALLHTKKACFGCAQRLEAVFFKSPQSSRISELVNQVSRLEGATATERLLVEAKTLELLALASDSSSLSAAPKLEPCLRSEDEDALSIVASHLEDNLASAHSLSDLSRKARLNEFKLKKGFRERYQTTVFGYLRQKRMEHARELLRSSDCTVLSAANAVGYSNPSHFTRAFRETFGLNPKEFLAAK